MPFLKAITNACAVFSRFGLLMTLPEMTSMTLFGFSVIKYVH